MLQSMGSQTVGHDLVTENNKINYLVNGAEANFISMENAFTLHSMKKKQYILNAKL